MTKFCKASYKFDKKSNNIARFTALFFYMK